MEDTILFMIIVELVNRLGGKVELDKMAVVDGSSSVVEEDRVKIYNDPKTENFVIEIIEGGE